MSEHAQWIKEQRRFGSPEEEPTASAFAVEKLRATLHGADVPERELHQAASVVEKKATEISARHSGRVAMIRILGKKFYVNQVPANAFNSPPRREEGRGEESSHSRHPDSDHVRRLYG